MKKKNPILAILFVFAIATIGSLSSCSTTEDCWAYRSCSKNAYNNSKHRPSVACATGKKRVKLRR